MPELRYRCREIGDVALVELAVESERPQRVRVRATCRPVWPPRRHGRPTAGWDEGTVAGVAGPDGRFVAGFATPAPAADPPAEIAETAPADGSVDPIDRTDETDRIGTGEVTPTAVARALGEAGPPAAAVTPGSPDETDSRTVDTGEAPESDGASPVAAWLDAVAARVERAERLAAATTASEAREATETVGGLEAVRELRAQLARDAEAIETVRRRARRLDDRLAETEVPLRTIERVVE